MEASAAQRVDRPVVVVVEDEEDVRNLVAMSLRAADLDVVSVESLAAARAEVERRAPAVVVVDRMLPDGDGIELCARIRAEPRFLDVGLLLLTALGSEQDRLDGLAVGADDYVVKPFSVRELVARVRVLVALADDRRVARAAGETGDRFQWRDLEIDAASHRAFAAGREIDLRPLEMKILVALFRARGAMLSRADLVRVIWGDDSDVRPRLVDIHVWRLRERLAEWADVVVTVHGSGYRIATD